MPSSYLKSSLDRFIAQQNKDREDQERHLKSSLDRFIGEIGELHGVKFISFKIQFG